MCLTLAVQFFFRAAGIAMLTKVLAGFIGAVILGVLVASAYQVWQHPDRAAEVWSRCINLVSFCCAPQQARRWCSQLLVKFFTGPIYVLGLICLEVILYFRVWCRSLSETKG